MKKKIIFIILLNIFLLTSFENFNNATIETNIEETNTNLETLAIENELLNIPFDPSITEYSVEISDKINTLNILAIPENENATVEIHGKENIKEGNNLVKITVTSQNGLSQKIYKINVYKRSLEEEIEYDKKVEENQKELEQIYNTQKLSTRYKKYSRENRK